jgi:hypothetical protein
MNQDKDILGEAVDRLKRDTLSQQVPKAVVEETLRRLADAQPDEVSGTDVRRIPIGRTLRLALAAAALIAVGCVIGRLSGPAPVNMGKLQEALAPSLAASIEPALRAKVVEDLQQRYQLALAATYVKVKKELTEQYHDDLNRFAVLTLAASNATTNRRLAELVESIDSAQAQDLHRVARVLSQIEQDRVQDKTQFAAGLEKLASRTEETRQFVQLLVDVLPEDSDEQRNLPIENPNERNDP